MSDADDPAAPDGDEEAVRDVVRVDGDEPPADGDGEDDGQPVGRDGVMDPEDLDIRERDEVAETDDGRYVISTGGGRDDPPELPPATEDPEPPATEEAESSATPPPASTPTRPEDPPAGDDGSDPLDAVAAELGDLSASHGFALAVAAGGETDTLRVAAAEPTDVAPEAVLAGIRAGRTRVRGADRHARDGAAVVRAARQPRHARRGDDPGPVGRLGPRPPVRWSPRRSGRRAATATGRDAVAGSRESPDTWKAVNPHPPKPVT